jgi:hypothetical protein
MQHWYVYYKVQPEQRDDTIATVRRLQHSLAQSCGVNGRLLERNSGDSLTLMEVYEHVGPSARFAAALEEVVSRSALPSELRASRRVECFQDIG